MQKHMTFKYLESTKCNIFQLKQFEKKIHNFTILHLLIPKLYITGESYENNLKKKEFIL